MLSYFKVALAASSSVIRTSTATALPTTGSSISISSRIAFASAQIRPISSPPVPGGYFARPFSSTTVPNMSAQEDNLPSAPHRYLSRPDALDLSELEIKINNADDKRQAAYELSRSIGVALTKCRAASELGGEAQNSAELDLDQILQKVFDMSVTEGKSVQDAKLKPRDGNLSYKVEDYLRYKSYFHFLKTGKLMSPSLMPGATDEEFLAGACIGLCQELSRYGVGRATVRDVKSVQMARDLVSDINTYLLQFDFRNGPLRRKYDGVKYALKSLETVLYELSVTGADVADAKDQTGEMDVDGDVKKLLPTDELDEIKKRMEHRDELREKLIKRCRDGQKAAKQSIFALHRGDKAKAERLMEECENVITNDLLPIVDEAPTLRYGSFANVLEELVEARMFYSWLFGKDGKSKCPAGTFMTVPDFSITLEPEEYLGGICDLTGEIGRYAVQRGTSRDTNSVQKCLEANLTVLLSLQSLSRFPSGGGLGKKIDPLRRSVEKIERMMYELSLVEATGGKRKVIIESGKGNVDGDNED